jgi:glycosyltransferase involved in cell wall biosynthesis
MGRRAALDALRRWKPDVLYSHGLLSPKVEAETLNIAPAAIFVHGYYGTCISGSKTVGLRVRQPCTRAFGPGCLLQFYPRRCGGLNPVTMAIDYRRQAARLGLLGRYARVLTSSEHMFREYCRYPGLADRICKCPYPAEAPMVPRPENAASVRSGPAHLLFVGRMDRGKGGELALAALALAAAALDRQLLMTFIGDGPDRPRWEARAGAIMRADRRIEVRFSGWQSGAATARYLPSADLLVVPSVWPEPFGLVGVEAGRHGVPAAAFAVGGIPEWLKSGENGELAPADPPTAAGLAAAIVGCLIDPQRHAVMRERARALATERDNLDRHLETLVPLLARAAGSSVRMPR